MPKFMSVVKFKVKLGEEKNFIDSMKKFQMPDGVIFRKVIELGDNCYCSVMEWVNEEALVNARPQMIAFLDTIRNILEKINEDLGVTDPTSGSLIIDQRGLVTEPGKTISGKIKV